MHLNPPQDLFTLINTFLVLIIHNELATKKKNSQQAPVLTYKVVLTRMDNSITRYLRKTRLGN